MEKQNTLKNITSLASTLHIISYIKDKNQPYYYKISHLCLYKMLKSIFIVNFTIIDNFFCFKTNKLFVKLLFNDNTTNWYLGKVNNKEKKLILIDKINKL